MSDFGCPAVRVGPIEKHPNADSLGITHVYAYPVIVRLGDFAPGDLALYVPVDAVVPCEGPFAFLADPKRPGKPVRIKAKRLRGVFSMGLLTPAPKCASEGEDFAARFGIVKYEEPEPLSTGGEDAPSPPGMPAAPKYDIEGYRRWPDVLVPGEEVEITEKIHGCNGRFICWQSALHVGSHTRWKRDSESSVWWRAARQLDLADRLAWAPGMLFYGEVFGQVQDLRYGSKPGEVFLRFFDVFDPAASRWFDRDERLALCSGLGLPTVPDLHVGPWDPALLTLAEGQSTLAAADHVREGIVIKPVRERFDDRIGRVILKCHGESYLTRKGGTERR